MDGRCSCRAVCDRLLTLLNEEVVEYIRLILRCGSLVWLAFSLLQTALIGVGLSNKLGAHLAPGLSIEAPMLLGQVPHKVVLRAPGHRRG